MKRKESSKTTTVTSAITIRAGSLPDFSVRSEFQCLLFCPSSSFYVSLQRSFATKSFLHPKDLILSLLFPAVSTIDKRYLTTETKSYARSLRRGERADCLMSFLFRSSSFFHSFLEEGKCLCHSDSPKGCMQDEGVNLLRNHLDKITSSTILKQG